MLLSSIGKSSEQPEGIYLGLKTIAKQNIKIMQLRIEYYNGQGDTGISQIVSFIGKSNGQVINPVKLE
jgi:hypothetical protein